MTLHCTSDWLRSHRGFFADLIRLYLGIGLLIKGVFFLRHPDALAAQAGSLSGTIVGFAPYVHLVGGVFLALGLATRVAAIIQVPIVAGALLAVHLPNMTGMAAREAFEFSALTLFLLALIAVWGGGPLSVDRWLSAWRDVSGGEGWLASHSDLFLDLIRAYLGIGLFVKGFYILEHQNEFQRLIENTGTMPISLLAAAHYIIPVHFVGGLMLLLGLATRVGAIAQIPLLVGAIFYVYLPRFSTLELRHNLEFTGLVLFLLCILGLCGSGRYSLDFILHKPDRTEPASNLEEAHA